jgi:hypothetical protein
LEFRLGMFECPQCGYERTQDALEERQERVEQAEVKRRKLPTWVPPVSGAFDEPKGKVFNPADYDAHAKVTTIMRRRVQELLPEKLIVLAIYTVQAVIGVFMFIPFYHLLAFAAGGTAVAGIVLCFVLNLALWAWVLLCHALWAKYLFLLIALAGVVAGLIFAGMTLYYVLSEKFNPYGAVYQLGLIFWIILAVSVLTSAWIAWILKRDIEYFTFPS